MDMDKRIAEKPFIMRDKDGRMYYKIEFAQYDSLVDKIDTLETHIQHDEFYAIRRTKNAIWAKIQRDAGSCLYISLTQAREAIEQAIDSVGRE